MRLYCLTAITEPRLTSAFLSTREQADAKTRRVMGLSNDKCEIVSWCGRSREEQTRTTAWFIYPLHSSSLFVAKVKLEIDPCRHLSLLPLIDACFIFPD